MMMYLLTFIVSTLLIQVVVSRSTPNLHLRILSGIGAVGITAAVAGARDFGVGGPDVSVYGNTLYESAVRADTIFALIRHAEAVHIDGDFGYVLINFIVSRFSDDSHVFYFWLSFLVSSLVLTAILLMREQGPASLMWLTYLCTAYVDTFNLLRQAPALAFALVGVAITLRRQPLLGLAVGSIGILFHLSGAVFIVMWMIALHLRSESDQPRPGRLALVLALAAGVLALGAFCIQYFELLFPNSKYASYLVHGARPGSPVGVDSLYRLVPILAGLAAMGFFTQRATHLPAPFAARESVLLDPDATIRFVRGSRSKGDMTGALKLTGISVLTTLVTYLIIELVVLPLREISYPLYRIPMYFGFMRIFAYSIIVARLPQKFAWWGRIGLVLFVLAYFVLITLMRNDAGYSSAIFDSWWR